MFFVLKRSSTLDDITKMFIDLISKRHIMKKAFSLAELMIVLAILGILAAIVLPYFRTKTTEAKGAVAKDHLRMLRGAIELYTAQHSGVPPGYEDNNPQNPPSSFYFNQQVILQGDYIPKMPANPFNKLDTINMIGNNGTFPTEPTGNFGWVYQPAIKTIKLDWPGTDETGLRYFDY